MELVEVASDGAELLSHEELKRHLGVYGGDQDQDFVDRIKEAREECERCTQRTLRSSVTRQLIASCWDEAFVRLPWPPVIAVSSVSYYADGASSLTVLPTTSYRLVPSGTSVALLEWVENADRPSLDARSDAVIVEYTTGYGDVDSIPHTAKAAVKLKAQSLWGRDDTRVLELADKRADQLLAGLTVGHYR